MEWTDELRDAVNALIRQSGRIMLGQADPEHERGAVSEKPGAANYVTQYDVRVQTALETGLSALFPQAKFFAEEQENDIEDAKRGLCFVIDPIDGTTNFIHHMGCSAVSVALFENGVPVYGAVLDPYRDELFYAVKGGGAFLNGAPIRASRRDLAHALVSFGTSPYDRARLADASFDRAKRIFLRCADLRRSGSAAIDICCVACGRTDAFFEDILSAWDFAAGGLILSEAGGRLSAYDGGLPGFGCKSSVLCTNGLLHGAMLELINQ